MGREGLVAHEGDPRNATVNVVKIGTGQQGRYG